MAGGDEANHKGNTILSSSYAGDEPSAAPLPSSSGRIEEADFVTRNEDQDLKRGLSQRHISLYVNATEACQNA